MKIFKIETETLKLDGGAMFGVVPKSIWQNIYPADDNNLCTLAMRCVLIIDEENERKILIDTGIGQKQKENFLKYYHLDKTNTLNKSLKEINISPNEITDVIITHLHFDHCGGAVNFDEIENKYSIAFPNANYYISQSHWNWTTNNPNRREKPSLLKENIFPIKESGKLRLIDEDTQLYPNIFIKLYYGHTEGQIVPFIKYKNKTIVYLADLIPTSAHIRLSFLASYDIRPLIALKEKEELLEEAVKNGYILVFEHDINCEAATIKETDKGFVIDKIIKINEM